jgi:protein phosphatase
MIQGFLGWLKKTFWDHSESDSPAPPEGPKAEHAMKRKPLSAKKPKAETCVLQPAYTVRLKLDTVVTAPSTADTLVTWCGLTDTGRVRDHNEDFFSCTAVGESILFVVADGMGGQDAGEVASKLAVDTVRREVESGIAGHQNDPQKLLECAVQRANAAVACEGASKGSDMGTTLTLALVAQDRAYIANVGDSRTYWMENGSIRQITEDHSLVAKLVSVGKLTREEARTHPQSNLLYRNIGSDGPVKVDTFQVDLRKGGSLLLCTDGLWNEVTDEDIHSVCAAESDTKAACARLIEMANKNGGKDNITAVVVRVE